MKVWYAVAITALCPAVLCLLTHRVAGEAPSGELWNYVTVREGAHMFWWLYGLNGTINPAKPLVMWLQVRLDDHR